MQAALLAISSADDERDPPLLGIEERELKRTPGGRLHVIAASDLAGHSMLAIDAA